MSPGRRMLLASSAALLLVALAAGAIVAAQPRGAERQRIVEGWLVEEQSVEGGGRLLRIVRTSGAWRLEYNVASRDEGDGALQRVSATGGNCDEQEELDRYLRLHVSEIRSRLAAALARCSAPPRVVEPALSGLEPAYALAQAWDWEAAVAAAAAIEPPPMYGADDAMLNAYCDTPEGTAEREAAEMNATESAQAAAC